MKRRTLEDSDTYTFLAVKHITEVFVGLRVLADEGEYPLVRLVVRTEGYPVQLAVILHVLDTQNIRYVKPRHFLYINV